MKKWHHVWVFEMVLLWRRKDGGQRWNKFEVRLEIKSSGTTMTSTFNPSHTMSHTMSQTMSHTMSHNVPQWVKIMSHTCVILNTSKSLWHPLTIYSYSPTTFHFSTLTNLSHWAFARYNVNAYLLIRNSQEPLFMPGAATLSNRPQLSGLSPVTMVIRLSRKLLYA